MSVLSEENQKLLENYLVEDKVISIVDLDKIKEKAKADSTPLLTALVSEAHVSNEIITK